MQPLPPIQYSRSGVGLFRLASFCRCWSFLLVPDGFFVYTASIVTVGNLSRPIRLAHPRVQLRHCHSDAPLNTLNRDSPMSLSVILCRVWISWVVDSEMNKAIEVSVEQRSLCLYGCIIIISPQLSHILSCGPWNKWLDCDHVQVSPSTVSEIDPKQRSSLWKLEQRERCLNPNYWNWLFMNFFDIAFSNRRVCGNGVAINIAQGTCSKTKGPSVLIEAKGSSCQMQAHSFVFGIADQREGEGSPNLDFRVR